MAASEDFIDTFYNSIRDLHSVRKSLNKEYAAGLVKMLKRAAEDISDHTGKFLHQLRENKPDDNTLEKMISASPSSLSYKNDRAQLPIQSAAESLDSFIYVALLAKKGVKHNVGGEGKRGGLLVADPTYFNNRNILKGMGYRCYYEGRCGKAYVDMMKELRDAVLFTKDDIKNYGLLYQTCHSEGFKQRFEFLSDWCPEGLKDHQHRNRPIIHAIIKNNPIETFAMFLKAATKHHGNEASLLFQTDTDGTTACERAFKVFGEDEAMQVIGDFIPFDNPQLPILHHVAKHAPHLMNIFVIRYMSAAYLRDENGRNLDQAILASGNTTLKNNGFYFVRLSDDQVREIDPANDLYPFMVAASGNTSDLSAVFALLRRNPSLVRGGNSDDGGRVSNRRRRRRRLRSTERTDSTKRSK